MCLSWHTESESESFKYIERLKLLYSILDIWQGYEYALI